MRGKLVHMNVTSCRSTGFGFGIAIMAIAFVDMPHPKIYIFRLLFFSGVFECFRCVARHYMIRQAWFAWEGIPNTR